MNHCIVLKQRIPDSAFVEYERVSLVLLIWCFLKNISLEDVEVPERLLADANQGKKLYKLVIKGNSSLKRPVSLKKNENKDIC